jgi:hypothetical protein
VVSEKPLAALHNRTRGGRAHGESTAWPEDQSRRADAGDEISKVSKTNAKTDRRKFFIETTEECG